MSVQKPIAREVPLLYASAIHKKLYLFVRWTRDDNEEQIENKRVFFLTLLHSCQKGRASDHGRVGWQLFRSGSSLTTKISKTISTLPLEILSSTTHLEVTNTMQDVLFTATQVTTTHSD